MKWACDSTCCLCNSREAILGLVITSIEQQQSPLPCSSHVLVHALFCPSLTAIETEIAEISSNSSSEFEQRQRHRKKRRKIKRKSKKEVSQLFKITSKIAELLSSLKTERIKQK